MINRILHIANDYAGSKVYMHLMDELSKLGVPQVIYSAVRAPSLLDKNKLEHIPTHYSPILTPYCRINYYYKRNLVFEDLCSKIDIENIKQVHAHTWFSDGGVALAIKKKFGIPYTVSIRNTDINVFWRYLIHLRRTGLEILREANRVVFISEAHKRRLLSLISKYGSSYSRMIESADVVPNGIDKFWLNNFREKSREIHSPFRLLYVGKFDPGKNVVRLIKSLNSLNSKENTIQYHLTLIGGTGKDEVAIRRLVARYPEQLTLKGWTNSKEELQDIYRSSDAFVMPSLRETFGLVYIEAMTQGLPVLFTLGEGIDGIFDSNSALGCNPKNIQDISRKIQLLREQYSIMSIDQEKLNNLFRWPKIAEFYKESIYQL